MRSIPASTEGGAVIGGASAEPVLGVSGLSVAFDTPGGTVTAVRDVTLSVGRGECLGVIGASGAGKSQLFLAVMGLLPANARVGGSARFLGTELIGLSRRALDRVRGAGIGMVFQDPMSSLTPHLPVGGQIAEVLVRHQRLSRRRSLERA
ncbi:MAG TPA: ATP-binding cassette domain-containing protein, partial [Steroidobacteraceae bacterium]|nr:ATP-binding cassette domain-containing protein [Steroidobacteraceae bacterium]